MKNFHPLVLFVVTVAVALFLYSLVSSLDFQSTSIDGKSTQIEVKKNSFDAVTRGWDDNVDTVRNLESELSLATTDISSLGSQLKTLKQGVDALSNTSHQELTAVRQELSELKKLLEAISEKNNYESLNMNRPNKNSIKSEETTLESLKEADREFAQKSLERWDVIGTSFQSEQIDGQWSTETTQKITDLFENSSIIKADLSQIDCRETLCFVEAQLKDKDEARKFSAFFPMQIGQTLPNVNYSYENHEDGSVTISMYLEK